MSQIETFRQQSRFLRTCVVRWQCLERFMTCTDQEEKGIYMRKLGIMAVLATTALSAPAMAKDGAWYVGIDGGAMIVEDMKFDATNQKVNNILVVGHKTGYDIDGVVGY